MVATTNTSAAEDAALSAAIASAKRSSDIASRTAPIQSFLDSHPTSGWRLALLTNLGLDYYRTGYYSRALQSWQSAWDAGKTSSVPQAKALADRAIGELARMHARVGHADELERLFTDLGSRAVSGSSTELITGAREGLWMFRNDPGISYLCGPMALKSLLGALQAPPKTIAKLHDARSGPHGFSLSQVGELATKAGLSHTLIKRQPNSEVPVPSVVHWKLNHYAAIVEQRNGLYHIKDPTFGSPDVWVSKEAIDEESSGHFLTPIRVVHDDWKKLTRAEADKVYGMGFTGVSQIGANKPNDTQIQGQCGIGMCVADAKAALHAGDDAGATR